MVRKPTKIGIVLTSVLVMAAVLFAAACGTENGGASSSSVALSSSEVSSAIESSKSKEESIISNEESSQTETSLPPQSTEYLAVLGMSYGDLNSYVVAGKCEVGATVTAVSGGQNVTSASDNGFFSVRLTYQAGANVTLTAKGEKTETVTVPVKPVRPSGDMWPIVPGDGYQFFFAKMMPDFMGEKNLTVSQSDYLANRIRGRVDDLKKYSPKTEIIYLLVPSAASIYPERVPADYKPAAETRLQQVSAALKKGGATVLDLQKLFTEHKNDEMKVTGGTDSHWTDYGAFLAYQELFTHISKKFPDAKPREISEFDFKPDFYEGGDMVYYLAFDRAILREHNHMRVPLFDLPGGIGNTPRYRGERTLTYHDAVTREQQFYTNRSSLPSLYVMRDSFSTQIYDILAERGSTTYFRGMWNTTFFMDDIAAKKPDYIIYIVSEWNLDSIIQG